MNWWIGQYKHYCQAIKPKLKIKCKSPAIWKGVKDTTPLYTCNRHKVLYPGTIFKLIKKRSKTSWK